MRRDAYKLILCAAVLVGAAVYSVAKIREHGLTALRNAKGYEVDSLVHDHMLLIERVRALEERVAAVESRTR